MLDDEPTMSAGQAGVPVSAAKVPKVVMLVGNDVTGDTRVRKMAAAVGQAGLDVTVVGLSPTGKREETTLPGARVIRVPVEFTLRDARKEELRRERLKRQRRREALSRLRDRRRSALDRAQIRRRARLHKLAQREANAEVGRLKSAILRSAQDSGRLKHAVTAMVLRRRIARVRRAAHRRQRKFEGWRSRVERQLAADSRPRAEMPPPQPPQPRHRTPRTLPRADWRRALPELEDYEVAYGPVIDELAPDVIHAHDVHVIGIAERAAARAQASGREVRIIYDAHEYTAGVARYDDHTVAAYVALEHEYGGRFDRVITVSEQLADLLVHDLRLRRRPAVVLNVPLDSPGGGSGPTVRQYLGLDDDVPLAVYSGGIHKNRGVSTLVDVLALVDDLHVALVVKRESAQARHLVARAEEAGTQARLHLAPYVESHEVARYLSDADVGVHSLVAGWLNHEVALPNKLFEYLHAGLPLVVSNCEAMAEFVRQAGAGESFESGNVEDLAKAIRSVLHNRDRYVAAVNDPALLRKYSWESQQEILLQVYEELTGTPLSRGRAERDRYRQVSGIHDFGERRL